MKMFYANASPENWPLCRLHNIFGIRKGQPLPKINPGDLILVRVTGKQYGVISIWLFDKAHRVKSETFVPWKDSDYDWILDCKPLIDEFDSPFSEGFATNRKKSQNIEGLFASTIMGSMGELKPELGVGYLTAILKEKSKQLNGTLIQDGKEIPARDYISQLIHQFDTPYQGELVIEGSDLEDVYKEEQPVSAEALTVRHGLDNVWCIYVENDALANFNIGINNGVWGTNIETRFKAVKEQGKDLNICKGDLVLFVHGLVQREPKSTSFPRLALDVFLKQVDHAKSLLLGRVTSEVFESNDIIWKDGIYPYRFNFKEISRLENVPVAEKFTDEQMDALRRSAINNGKIYLLIGDISGLFSEMEVPFAELKEETPDEIILEEKMIQPMYSIPDFVSDTGYSPEEIGHWVKLIRRKHHVIFQGPPGTGKTFVAERLARLLVSETTGAWEVVQFHPVYSYEDFIQGYYPEPAGGALQFVLKSGRFLDFCKRAARDETDSPFVLIIDEINRANLARVFGELMYLLEYRDKAIYLAAGGKHFQIPKNVYLIGTMNTADRSIALVDHALRRRFSFMRLKPEYDILKAELSKHKYPADDLIKVLKEINQAIDDPNYEVGISFFMVDGENLKELLPSIWVSEIEPYLEEYFYDQPGKVKSFRWETLSQNKLKVWVE